MTSIALLLAALMPTPQPGPVDPAAPVAPLGHVAETVLGEMAPAPGRWEVEDAPAYFTGRTDIKGAPAPGDPASAGTAAGAREGAALVARRRP